MAPSRKRTQRTSTESYNRENGVPKSSGVGRIRFTLISLFVEKLSGANRCVRSPRMSPNRDTLIWLERGTGGPHHNAMALMKLKIPTNIIVRNSTILPTPNLLTHYKFL